MHRSLAFFVVLALMLVAGCAPSVVGSRNNPVPLDEVRTVVTTADSSVYLVAVYQPEAFGYRSSDLPGRFVPWRQGAAAQVTPLFSLREVVAPEGWSLAIEGVRGYLWPSAPNDVVMEATLVLEVPPRVRLGGQRVRAILEAVNGRRQTIEIIVQVVP
jgi:hypothetical protein